MIHDSVVIFASSQHYTVSRIVCVDSHRVPAIRDQSLLWHAEGNFPSVLFFPSSSVNLNHCVNALMIMRMPFTACFNLFCAACTQSEPQHHTCGDGKSAVDKHCVCTTSVQHTCAKRPGVVDNRWTGVSKISQPVPPQGSYSFSEIAE